MATSGGALRGVVAGQEVEAFFASGLGGQNIFVLPALDLVVVFTAPLDTPDGNLQNTLVLQDYILPAVLPPAEVPTIHPVTLGTS